MDTTNEEKDIDKGMYRGEDYSTGPDFVIPEIRLGTPGPLRVITIGAGASGLNLAKQIASHMRNVEHIIYDKNKDIGGTWLENIYPGCACDIPSSNYQFTWEPWPEWNYFYSPASEILQYFRHVALKHDLYKFIKLSHRVIGAKWDENTGKWVVKIENLLIGEVIYDECDFLINGSGVLNNWKWPDIPGLKSFKGQLCHSAAWDPDIDVTGKKIAVLGCGSSGVQLVPALQPVAKELVTFIRTPTWITAGFARSKAGPDGSNFKFTAEQKDTFRNDHKAYLMYRKDVEAELNSRFKFIMKDSPEQAEARRFSTNEMKSKLGHDSRLIEHLIPSFSVGCRRPTPGNGYLEALTQKNVRVVTDSITEIVPEGIKTSTGELIKVDIFICATGFDMSFSPRFSIIGQNGISLADQWKEKPTAYLSLATANFPNYFMFLGPNAPVGHGSILPIVEHAAKYIVRFLHKCQTQGIKSVVPKQAAITDFEKYTDLFMKRTAWTTHCRSWFKNGKIDGPVVALHPGSRVHWFHMLSDPRYEDWEWEYFGGNRFAYLGNGFSTREEIGRDSTYYFDEPNAGYESVTY